MPLGAALPKGRRQGLVSVLRMGDLTSGRNLYAEIADAKPTMPATTEGRR
jgi:hypothetical protein